MRLTENTMWLISMAVVLGFEVYGLCVLGQIESREPLQTFNPACDRAAEYIKVLQDRPSELTAADMVAAP